MKILYIITQADGGGAQKYVLALAKHFGGAIAAGHSTLRDEPSGSDSKRNEASKLFDDAGNLQLTTYNLKHLKRNISPWHDFLAVWEMHRLIKSYQPDIVHLNSTKAGILGSFAAIGTKTKVVFTAHGFVFNEPLSLPVKNFYLALEKIASSYRDFIIAVSDADRQSALDNKIIAADKITTIHNGLPKIDFLPGEQAKRKLGLDENKIIIGNTSNFYLTKGLDVLIKSAALLDKTIRDRCQFVIIGDGPEVGNLKLGIGNLQLKNTVKFLGKKDNAAIYVRAFDVFVLPSRKEGLPFALLEAMQAGLPIIATNVGGIPEALGDAGILIKPEDPKALVEAINTILLDSNIVKVLSAKALERSKLFTEQKMLAETEKVYKKMLG